MKHKLLSGCILGLFLFAGCTIGEDFAKHALQIKELNSKISRLEGTVESQKREIKDRIDETNVQVSEIKGKIKKLEEKIKKIKLPKVKLPHFEVMVDENGEIISIEENQ
jgi:outer membrane murein-binding lipoprotein Lpp